MAAKTHTQLICPLNREAAGDQHVSHAGDVAALLGTGVTNDIAAAFLAILKREDLAMYCANTGRPGWDLLIEDIDAETWTKMLTEALAEAKLNRLEAQGIRDERIEDAVGSIVGALLSARRLIQSGNPIETFNSELLDTEWESWAERHNITRADLDDRLILSDDLKVLSYWFVDPVWQCAQGGIARDPNLLDYCEADYVRLFVEINGTDIVIRQQGWTLISGEDPK